FVTLRGDLDDRRDRRGLAAGGLALVRVGVPPVPGRVRRQGHEIEAPAATDREVANIDHVARVAAGWRGLKEGLTSGWRRAHPRDGPRKGGVMADTPLGSMETPEEVLESEIRELEKRTLNSGWLWGAAALALVLLAAAAFLITFWDTRQAIAHRAPGA